MARDNIDTGSEDILAYEDDGVVVITLNRPQARNAMSGEMNAGLEKTLDYAERASQVKAIVLTGSGRGFCSGGNVEDIISKLLDL